MGMRVGVAEFLEKVSKLKKKEEKVEALRMNDSYVIRTILQGAFDPRIKWLIPSGTPPFKANQLVDQENVLIKEARKLVYFVEGGGSHLKSIKRETMFIELLESVAPADAILLCAIKEKKLPWKGITVDVINEAFPNFIPVEEPAV
jgi:Family of unknown function (DUF6433)